MKNPNRRKHSSSAQHTVDRAGLSRKATSSRPCASQHQEAQGQPASGRPVQDPVLFRAPKGVRDNSPAKQPARKRGGQLNNQNAIKHGFRAGEPSRGAASSRRHASLGHASQGQASTAHPGGTSRQDSPADQPARKRGGQLNNRNAIKHGFYSAIFKKTERALLSEIPLDDLSAEIELIRVTSQRFLRALVASKDELDFEAQLTALRAVNLSAHSLATLLRAHALGALYRRDFAEATLRNQNDSPSDM